MSYVPRHARTPVYKKVLRTASASVAVTAAFVSSQPAFAADAAESTTASTSTTAADTTAADTAATPADTPADTAASDSASEDKPADDTSDTFAPEVDNNAAFGAGVADFFSTILRAFGSIAEGAVSTPDKPADSAERITVQPGETRTIDVTDKVDRSDLESHKVDGIELDNAAELANLGVHAKVLDLSLIHI